MKDVDIFPERVRQAVRAAGGARKISEVSGLSGSTIGNWTSGASEPRVSDLRRLAEATGRPIEWFFGGADDRAADLRALMLNPIAAAVAQATAEDYAPEYAPVRRVAISASAGDGAFAVEDAEQLSPLAFKASWLKRVVSEPARAVLLNAKGDSMSPLILDGDLMLVDQGHRKIGAGGIFVFRLDDEIVVKRIAMAGERRVRITSEASELFPPFDVNIDDLHLVGRVRWIGRNL